MQKMLLNGAWEMLDEQGNRYPAQIPGSVYSTLLASHAMEDPFYRDNELAALKLMEKNYTFTRKFCPDAAMLKSDRILLRCEGLDTLCVVTLNGKEIAKTDNMHRTWEFDVTDVITGGENTLCVECLSPTKYIREEDEKTVVHGSTDAMKGFPHLRKPHCMFGWDWGPRLPDAGIWRDISLVGVDSSRLEDIYIEQRHENGDVWVTVHVRQSKNADVKITMTAPDGAVAVLENDRETKVVNPQLWWPNGYGAQPLYTILAALVENGITVDHTKRRIGLRVLTMVREKDQWGESFAPSVNGVQYFAMGADYIPEDNVFARITPDRTYKLLEQCVAANFNSVRVWGGGYYPDDWFYDACDELGLVVWQDFMFACANYLLTVDFEKSIRAEFIDNIRRLRHHASLGLWCGNNEMEMFQITDAYESTPKTRADYIRMFEHIIPEVLREYDPHTFYWPASPSSGGSFDEPNDPNRGDVHYWDVWHGEKPFTDYRNYFFRYASEFGFQSFPCMKTIESFTVPEDRNIFSYIMEMHQRNAGANGKIMKYLAQTFLYPGDFDTLVFASQLLQAEAIRYGVEHWRRNRGRCMGAIYWQLNDIWPVASWASVDYYGRWKALHYYAKRFFAPLMLSCNEIGEFENREAVVSEPSPIETSAQLNVANETRSDAKVQVRWQLRSSRAEILQEGSEELSVPALTSVWLDKLDFNCTDYRENYFSYQLYQDGAYISGGTVLFTAPKHYHFRDPELSWKREGRFLTISAKNYAHSVEILSPDSDLVLSDNYFDLNGDSRTVEILEGDPKEICLRSVWNIR